MGNEKEQQFFSLMFVIVGSAGTAYAWLTVLNGGNLFYASAMGPGLIALGLGLLFFPVDMEAYQERTGRERLQYFDDYPTLQKAIAFVSLAIAFVHMYVVDYFMKG